MKPLTASEHDAQTLQQLGSASLQIVHDLKNQLNGLKLYATFLRRRMERDARPLDEIETIGKLMQGLERANEDATLLVRYARPLEPRRRPNDLREILKEFGAKAGDTLTGEYDAPLLAEALRLIFKSVDDVDKNTQPEIVKQHLATIDVRDARAEIVWRDVHLSHSGDAPFSSFVGSRGLRLALAAKIVEAHGGTIDYERVQNDTPVLRLRLPVITD